jgi:hypothetical protein
MSFNFSQLDKKSQITLGALAVVFVSTFFPWINIMGRSFSAWQAFETGGNFFAVLGLLSASVASYFFIKEKFDYALYAALVAVLNVLNWYFLLFGGFGFGVAKSVWRDALSSGFYLSAIGAFTSAYLLAERTGAIDKYFKKSAAQNNEVESNDDSTNESNIN